MRGTLLPYWLAARSRWRRPLAILLAALVLVIAMALLLPSSRSEPPAAPELAVNVAVQQIVPVSELADTFEVKGIVAPWATITLSAETAGRIESITAQEGDRVAANTPLVYLERDLLLATAEQARSKAEFDAGDLDRVRQAHQQGVASQMELERANSNAQVSKAARDFVEAQLRRAVIHTPAAPLNGNGQAEADLGVLNDVPVEVGEYVSPGTAVAQIIDDDPLKIMVDVPERDVRYMSVGQRVGVVIESLGDRAAEGAIRFISATADPRTRTFSVEVRLPNPGRDIRPGMIATVRLLRQVLRDAIMIPLDAVIPLENGYEVYVVNASRAHRREVSLGLIRGRQVQALGPANPAAPPLMPGDRLIVQGQRLVGEGQLVAVQQSAEALLAGASATPAGGPSTQPALPVTSPQAPAATVPAGREP